MRAAGVPTYSVPEAAVLLSISQEYLYRLIQAGGFPAVRMRIGGRQGRYVIPAKAVEQLLDQATDASACVETAEWTKTWQCTSAGGAA
jgi:excisionase family DNA binding protein